MRRILLVTASLFALMWAGAASADTYHYTPIPIISAGVNDQNHLTLTWVTPVQGLSHTSVEWKSWDPVLNQWESYYAGDEPYGGDTYTSGTTVWTSDLEAPGSSNAADGVLVVAVQVVGFDTACVDEYARGYWDYGCYNYSAWTRVTLNWSCTKNLVSKGHYVVRRPGHYLKRHGHYVYVTKHHHRVRVWVKPVRVWVKPLYGDPTCMWVNP